MRTHTTTIRTPDPQPTRIPPGAGDALPAGSVVGGFVIAERIGAGGMGVVYRATDPACGRTVAVKVMRPEWADDRHARALFVRESMLAALVEHPHVIPVYAAGRDADRLYLAMRYIDGQDLASLIARHGALPSQRALDILGRVARALETAHRRGVIHGDVKPSNILIGRHADEEVYLADFGLSCSAHGRHAHGGTPRYLAPEVAAGARLSDRSDVYALACTIYQTLTATPPQVADVHRPRVAAAARPSTTWHSVPADLMTVVAQAMAADPADRPPTPLAFAAAALRANTPIRHMEET